MSCHEVSKCPLMRQRQRETNLGTSYRNHVSSSRGASTSSVRVAPNSGCVLPLPPTKEEESYHGGPDKLHLLHHTTPYHIPYHHHVVKPMETSENKFNSNRCRRITALHGGISQVKTSRCKFGFSRVSGNESRHLVGMQIWFSLFLLVDTLRQGEVSQHSQQGNKRDKGKCQHQNKNSDPPSVAVQPLIQSGLDRELKKKIDAPDWALRGCSRDSLRSSCKMIAHSVSLTFSINDYSINNFPLFIVFVNV